MYNILVYTLWITEECDCVIPLKNNMKKNGASCKEGKMIIEDLCDLLCTVQSTKAKSGQCFHGYKYAHSGKFPQINWKYSE